MMSLALTISLALTYLSVGSLKSPAIVTITVTESVVYTGVRSMIEVWANVKDGYHIQANKIHDKSLVPTTLEVKHELLSISKKEFPPSKQFKLEGTENFLEVLDGKFPIKLYIHVNRKIKPGKYILDAKLRYQACDSRSCLFPRVLEFSIPIEVKSKTKKN